jgi:RND family efflux transporter MFP subunit
VSTEHADLSSLRIDHSKRDNFSEQPSGGKMKSIIIAIAVIVIAVIIGSFSGSLFESEVEVTLTRAQMQTPGQADAVLTASGYIVAQRKAAVASKGTGRLEFLGVVEGDKVTTNQVIARLEDNDIKAQLNQARANLKLQQADLQDAEANFNRQKALLESAVASQEAYDAAAARFRRVQAAIELAEAQVQGAEVALENTLIRAPFDGTVLTKNADVGEIVAPLAAGVNSRAAVVTIADMTSLQVEADVSESNIEKIIPGMDCEITLDAYPSQRYAGYVAKVVPTADRAKATVMVKVGFREYDRRVLPEMSAKVLFLKDNSQPAASQQPLLVVSTGAIATIDGKKIVYRVKDDRAVAVTVTTGQNLSGYTEITGGLSEGEAVISRANDTIHDGVKVVIK